MEVANFISSFSAFHKRLPRNNSSHEASFQKMGGGGREARWVWQSHLDVEKVLIGNTRKGRSLGGLRP